MDWKNALKGFSVPLLTGSMLFVLVKATDGWPSPREKMVVVDVSGLIRGAAARFAGTEGDNPLMMNRKLEAYKVSLVQSLNDFAVQNGCIVLTANQAFGEIPDMTEAFLSFVEERKK